MNITAALLVEAVGCTKANAELFAPLLADACERYEINTPPRLAAFLAQVGHESAAFRHLREIWGPTPAQQRYEGRADLGNTQPGDGPRFAGRGLIQTTGRFNYRRLTLRLRSRLGENTPDFEAMPEALEQAKWAALSAADYWDMHRLNDLADAGDFVAITKKINGGLNGQADRLARWDRAKRALAANTYTAAPTPKEDAMPLPAIVGTMGKILISAFTPLVAEKVNDAISRHTDRPDVAEQITAAVVDAAKTATGLTDPVEAVAEARKSPEVMAQVEQSTLDRLASMAPLLTQLEAMDRQRFADEEGSRAAAHARHSSDWDMTQTLVYGALGLVAALVLLVGGIAIYQVRTGTIAPEVWAQLAGLIGFATGVCVTIFSFRFGTTRNNTAKDMLIRELSTGNRVQP